MIMKFITSWNTLFMAYLVIRNENMWLCGKYIYFVVYATDNSFDARDREYYRNGFICTNCACFYFPVKKLYKFG